MEQDDAVRMRQVPSPLDGRLGSYVRILYFTGGVAAVVNAARAGDDGGWQALSRGGYKHHFSSLGSFVGAMVIEISYHTIASWLVGLLREARRRQSEFEEVNTCPPSR